MVQTNLCYVIRAYAETFRNICPKSVRHVREVAMETKLVNFNCPSGLFERFSEKAKQDELSRSTIIRALIESYVDGVVSVGIKVTVR